MRRSPAAPAEPAKRTSSGFSARSSPGLIEPVAQRIESETFDLPEPFGPDHDRDSGLEPDLDRIDERLEPAQLDRLQVHARGQAIDRPGRASRLRPTVRRRPRRSFSASCAAACSASFFERPTPVPTTWSSITAAAVNVRSCGGPSTSSTV